MNLLHANEEDMVQILFITMIGLVCKFGLDTWDDYFKYVFEKVSWVYFCQLNIEMMSIAVKDKVSLSIRCSINPGFFCV